jgi:hypothetical protein
MGRGNPQREEDDLVQLRSANDERSLVQQPTAFAVFRVSHFRASAVLTPTDHCVAHSTLRQLSLQYKAGAVRSFFPVPTQF